MSVVGAGVGAVALAATAATPAPTTTAAPAPGTALAGLVVRLIVQGVGRAGGSSVDGWSASASALSGSGAAVSSAARPA